MIKTYPAVLFIAKHGRLAAVALGLALSAIAAVLFVINMISVVSLVMAFIASLVVWSGIRLLAEIVEVVAETLLPR